MAEPSFLPRFTLMLSGLIVWAAHFLGIYIFTGLVCARPGWAETKLLGLGLVPLGIFAGTAVALPALLILARSASRIGAYGDERRFERFIALGGILLAAIAVIWETLPAIAVPVCV